MIIKYEATLDVDLDDSNEEEELKSIRDIIDSHISLKILGRNEILLESKVTR